MKKDYLCAGCAHTHLSISSPECSTCYAESPHPKWKDKKSVSRTLDELKSVTLLGNQNTDYKNDYAPGILETFPNKHPNNDYLVTFDAYEFSSLCPKTGQPDFANVYISYIPSEQMVESKSLKLYLFSFRNHGDFHEDCMNIIMKDLINIMKPKYIEVVGIFTPRGGIAIYPFVNYADPAGEYVSFKYSRLLNAAQENMRRK